MGRARDRLPGSLLGRVDLGAFCFGAFTVLGPLTSLDESYPVARRLISVGSAVALVLLFALAYRWDRVPFFEPVVAPALAVGVSYGLDDSMIVVGVCLGITVAQTMHGTVRQVVVRNLLLMPVVPVAVTLTLSSGRQLEWATPTVLGQVPLALLVAMLIRTLRGSLLAQAASQAREALVAATGRELIGLTDADEVRQVMRTAVLRLCDLTPGLALVTAVGRGGRLTVAATYGIPEPPPGRTLPRELARLSDRDLALRAVPDELAPLVDGALGVHRRWSVLGVVLETRGVNDAVLVGMAERTPAGTCMLLSTLSAQHSLADRACRAHAELRHQAHHDHLTGLPNRSLLFEQLDRALASRRHEKPADVVLMIIDLDGFKAVNDSRGHAAGDAVLVEVARRLHEMFDGLGVPARLGGDEFAVLLPDTNRGLAEALADRLWRRLEEPIDLPDDVSPVRVGASVGLAVAGAATGSGELIGLADVAMYAAKTGGCGGVEVFSVQSSEAAGPSGR